MRQSKFLELRDITQGDFAIKEGHLFYKNQLISKKGEELLVSSEEVFFLFDVEHTEIQKEFKKVIFLNFSWPRFYKCNDDIWSSQREIQFSDIDNRKHAYRLISYDSSSSTKAVGSNFQNVHYKW